MTTFVPNKVFLWVISLHSSIQSATERHGIPVDEYGDNALSNKICRDDFRQSDKTSWYHYMTFLDHMWQSQSKPICKHFNGKFYPTRRLPFVSTNSAGMERATLLFFRRNIKMGHFMDCVKRWMNFSTGVQLRPKNWRKWSLMVGNILSRLYHDITL